jgi:hypothetical protein
VAPASRWSSDRNITESRVEGLTKDLLLCQLLLVSDVEEDCERYNHHHDHAEGYPKGDLE